MRQTSRAVALLLTLETAQAVDRTLVLNVPTPTVGDPTSTLFFNPAAASLTTSSQQLNSRTAAYSSIVPNAIFASTQETGPAWKTATFHQAKAGASAGAVTFTVGSTCISCLGGGGVWCSRTYAYLETGASSTTYNSQLATAAGSMKNLSSSDTELTGGAALDQGACCESKAAFSTFIGTLSVPLGTFTAITSGPSLTPGISMIADACPAVQLGTWNAGTGVAYLWDGDAKLDDTVTAWSSWWCSNGLFKKVTANATKTMNSQQIIQAGTNKRTELAMVGCPQLGLSCDQTTSIAQLISASAATKVYAMPTSGFTVNDKCSWVVYAVDAAPTFVMQNSLLGTPAYGLVSANWQIHNMEYTAASSWSPSQQGLVTSPASSTGYKQTTPGLARDSMLPLFDMPADQFGSLRTWYGQGATAIDDVTGMSSNWSSVGQAPIVNTTATSLQLAAVKSQLYGNVANVPVQGNVIQASGTTALTATQNYGTYNGIQFDLRAMRYFPAMVAQTVWTAGSSLSTQYSTALASYNTAKTTWDAYVAILDKNAKQDAFAALFSPPKAPTVPPLPNMPWVPANYSGYVRATAAQKAAYAAGSTVGTTTASPTAAEFWTSLAAAQTVGGWGSFTATIFTFRNGWGKSFGTIGYSGDADNQSMSDVWNYKWTCAAASTTTQPTGSSCESTYTPTAGALPTTAQTATTNLNAVKMITVVSLWSTSNTNTALASTTTIPTLYAWATNGFQITFTASAWKSGIVGLIPLTANTAPDLAKSLSGIAGAQALAATSAAALAVAAALY